MHTGDEDKYKNLKIDDNVGGDVSSLGSSLTASANSLLKNFHFTTFCNRKAYRYAKYWVPVRDSPSDSELASYFRNNWWDEHVLRATSRLPTFPEWWYHNGITIRQRLNQKRTNDIGRIRATFKGKFSCDLQ